MIVGPQAYVFASGDRTCHCLPPKKLDPPLILCQTTIHESSQPPPHDRSVGRDVCLAIVGDGIVGLGVGLFVGGWLVDKALVGEAVGHNVGLVVVGDRAVGFGVESLDGGLLVGGKFF